MVGYIILLNYNNKRENDMTMTIKVTDYPKIYGDVVYGENVVYCINTKQFGKLIEMSNSDIMNTWEDRVTFLVKSLSPNLTWGLLDELGFEGKAGIGIMEGGYIHKTGIGYDRIWTNQATAQKINILDNLLKNYEVCLNEL